METKFRETGADRRVPLLLGFLLLSMAILCSCASQDERFTNAPKPPPLKKEPITDVAISKTSYQPMLTAVDFSSPQGRDVAQIEPAAGMMQPEVYDLSSRDVQTALDKQDVPKNCKLQHRFDRKALIAYEWGDNRIGFDVDGVSLGSSDLEAAMFTYTMRLSPDPKKPYKTAKEKCRYKSGWQGMLGSGYNEFFRRDDDTVFEGLKSIRHDIEDRF